MKHTAVGYNYNKISILDAELIAQFGGNVSYECSMILIGNSSNNRKVKKSSLKTNCITLRTVYRMLFTIYFYCIYNFHRIHLKMIFLQFSFWIIIFVISIFNNNQRISNHIYFKKTFDYKISFNPLLTMRSFLRHNRFFYKF